MKNNAITFVVMAAVSTDVFAQTTLKIYGVVDVGIVAERGGTAGSVNKLISGVASGSRLGFTGSEDLGNGMSANFLLESGFNIDDGTMGQGGLLFGRQGYGSLKGSFGTVTYGRIYTPHFWILTTVADPFQTGFAGSTTNIMAISGVRMNNTVMYSTPAVANLTANIAYGFGEVSGDSSANREIGASATYINGPVSLGMGYHNQNNAAATDKATNTILAGAYDFKVAKVHLAYGVNKGTGTADNTDTLIGLTAPFGPHTFLASYIRKSDKSPANQDANQASLGYTYALSKRTGIYSAYARIVNENGTAYRVGNSSTMGSGDKAFNLGIRHLF